MSYRVVLRTGRADRGVSTIFSIVRLILETTGLLFILLLAWQSIELRYLVWRHHRRKD